MNWTLCPAQSRAAPLACPEVGRGSRWKSGAGSTWSPQESGAGSTWSPQESGAGSTWSPQELRPGAQSREHPEQGADFREAEHECGGEVNDAVRAQNYDGGKDRISMSDSD
jgi:hypothetical protein